MTETARFARNTFWLGVAQALRFATSALLLILIPRALPEVAEYGRLTLAIALGGIFAVLVDFGLSDVTIRDIPADRSLAGRYLHNILGLKIGLGAAALALIALTCLLLHYPPETTTAVLLIGSYTVLNSFCISINHQFRALERMDHEAQAVAIQNALIAACVLLALYLTRRTVPVALGYLAASLIACADTMVLYRRKGGRLGLAFDAKEWANLLKRASYFALSNFVLIVYLQIDVVMLRQLGGDTEVGYYQAAGRVIAAAAVPAMVLLGAAVPALARLYAAGPERFNAIATRFTHVLLALTVPLAAMACMFSDNIILLLFGARYEPSGDMLRLLAVAMLAQNLAPYRVLLSVTGHQRAVFTISLAAMVLNIALNLYLIPAYGGWGAAMASVIAAALYTVALAGCVYRRLRLQLLDLPAAIIVVTGALFADGASRYLHVRLPVVIILYLALYGTVVAWGAFSPEERGQARASWRQLLAMAAPHGER